MVVEVYQFLKSAEIWIYAGLGFIALLLLRKVFMAIREYRGCIFGLEKDRARSYLFQQSTYLILLVMLVVGEFVFVTFAGNTIPALALVPTPTLDLSPSPTPIDAVEFANQGFSETPPPFDAGGAPSGGCMPGSLEWTSPTPGSEIGGIVELKGTVNIKNFGFYKYEYSQDNSTWNTIQAGTTAVTNGPLGNWDTSLLTAGDYSIRLIVTNNEGNALPPCVLTVKVMPK
jgi:hypothetical protein